MMDQAVPIDHSRSCPCKRIPLSFSSFTAAELGDLSSLSRRRPRPPHTVVDSAGNTPLHLAVQHGHVAVTAYLLQQSKLLGCNGDGTSIVNAGAATPLHRASFSGACGTMRLLMEHPDCNLLARDVSFGDQMTPLHKAASGGRYLAVQLLLQALEERQLLETALSLGDSQGKTPVEVARDRLQRVDQESQ